MIYYHDYGLFSIVFILGDNLKETYRRELPDSMSPLEARSFKQASVSANIYIVPRCKATRKVNGQILTDTQLENTSHFLDILQNARPGDTVMIHAAAGFGKSSLLCHTAIQWHKGHSSLDRYKYLYLLPVRRIKNHAESLERIITNDIHLLEEAYEAKVRMSLKFCCKLCLIMIDGFDEINDDVKGYTVLNELLTRKCIKNKRNFIQDAVVVISTRPNFAQHILYYAGNNVIDLPLYPLDNNDVKSYVSQMFSKCKDKSSMVYKTLLAIPAPDKIIHVPLFLAMLCCLCEDELENSENLETLSELRTTSSIIRTFWNFLLEIKYHKASAWHLNQTLLKTLERETRGRVKDLSRLCFDSLEKGIYVFSESLLHKYDLFPDDMIKLGPVDTNPTVDKSLSFIHASFQEYCAGMYIAENESALLKVLDEWRGDSEPTRLFRRYQNSLIYAVGFDSDLLSKVPFPCLRHVPVLAKNGMNKMYARVIDLSIECLLLHECENDDRRLEFLEKIKSAPVVKTSQKIGSRDKDDIINNYSPDINVSAYNTLVSDLGYSDCLDIVRRVYTGRDADNPDLVILPTSVNQSIWTKKGLTLPTLPRPVNRLLICDPLVFSVLPNISLSHVTSLALHRLSSVILKNIKSLKVSNCCLLYLSSL